MTLPSKFRCFLIIALVAGGYAVASVATGFGDLQKAWLDNHSAAHIAARIILALIFVGAGIAWLLDPSRNSDGRPTFGSRLWAGVALTLAALQLAALFFGNPFQ